MPFRGSPTCLKCQVTESPLWTNAENLGVLCLECVNETKETLNADLDDEDEKPEVHSRPRKRARTTRSYKTRLNPFAATKPTTSHKGRRTKSIPIKSPAAVATPVSSQSVFYKGFYYQIGDIVSMMDQDDKVYYAQITGFLTDQYCEKSASISWLLPTSLSPPPAECFIPSTYIMGPEEQLPRKLDCMEFVMHAPCDYFSNLVSPQPSNSPQAQPGYIWTRLPNIYRPAQPGTSRQS